ncbi:MAG: MBL fold metallo-hydrolase [candidate division Zixibacteria bacterium]|nr:MBL fold metallo-hydrolase [candidate division Zixibacteria bacterium]
MKLQTLVVGMFEVNCFLYWDEDTGDGVIIDPGDEAQRIIEAVDQAGFTPKAILLTHGHGDHIVALTEVKEKYRIPLYIGDGEQDLLANPSANVTALVGHSIITPPPDHLMNDGDTLAIGSVQLKVLMTPGHTTAGVCFYDEIEARLFTGDTLFFSSVGRTDLPGGSTEQLIDSIKTKILTLPDSVTCHPGHGPETTVGNERAHNPFLTGGLSSFF